MPITKLTIFYLFEYGDINDKRGNDKDLSKYK